MYILRLNPHTLCRVISGSKRRIILYLAQIEHVKRVDIDATVTINVRQRKEILCRYHLQTCLFHHLTTYSFLRGLAYLRESARQVKHSLSWFLFATLYKNLALDVLDYRHIGRTWIHKILKPAILALLACCAICLEVMTAAQWAILELF